MSLTIEETLRILLSSVSGNPGQNYYDSKMLEEGVKGTRPQTWFLPSCAKGGRVEIKK